MGESFQAQIFALIEETIGFNNLITVPSSLIHFCGDLEEAVFLGQLLYWIDRGKRQDGYIFKSKVEWQNETGLRRHTIDGVVKRLKKKGLLTVKLRQANGNPTLHYKLNRKAFIDAFSRFLLKGTEAISRNQLIDKSKSTNGLVENSDSITETTTETTHKKSKKGASTQQASQKHYPLSFFTYIERYSSSNTDVINGIAYFLDSYMSHFGKEHPRLRPGQWRRCIEALQLSDLWSSIKEATEIYFNTEYQDGCDYRLMHFLTPGVQEHLNYRLMGGDYENTRS
jgi:hypothetical protein